MEYVQILSCSSDLGSCCNDAGLVAILDIIRRVVELFQTIIPIVLLVMLIFQLTKMVINPDDKKGFASLRNRILAAFIIFFLPVIVNVTINIISDSNSDFQLSACWKTAQDMNEIQKSNESKYISTASGKKVNLLSSGSKGSSTSSSSGVSSGGGSPKGQAIVNYALKFVGSPYLYGGNWNGSIPYTATDCSGFVQGVFKHYGINLQRTTSAQWNDKSSYTLVSPNNIRAGDLAMYGGHVAIFTGNGTQIVHAANTKRGIIITDDYHNGASNFLGVMRINGVN